MRPVTMYEADDGTLYRTEAAAVAQDTIIAMVAVIMRPLGPFRALEGGEHVQHDPRKVQWVRTELLWYAGRAHPANARQEFDAVIQRLRTEPEYTAANSMVDRWIGDRGGPVYTAWFRLCCIAADGKEYRQPYYTTHQDEAAAEWARRQARE